MKSTLLRLLPFLLVLLLPSEVESKKAVCEMNGQYGHGSITGTIKLKQPRRNGNVTVEYDLESSRMDLVQQMNMSYHGFHVHKYGKLGDNCSAAGPHYNPKNKLHGSPMSAERHVGDLGNILFKNQGMKAKSKGMITVDMMSLYGEYSVLGRALVVHAYKDNFTGPSGFSGMRLQCCVIRESKAFIHSPSIIILLLCALSFVFAK